MADARHPEDPARPDSPGEDSARLVPDDGDDASPGGAGTGDDAPAPADAAGAAGDAPPDDGTTDDGAVEDGRADDDAADDDAADEDAADDDAADEDARPAWLKQRPIDVVGELFAFLTDPPGLAAIASLLVPWVIRWSELAVVPSPKGPPLELTGALVAFLVSGATLSLMFMERERRPAPVRKDRPWRELVRLVARHPAARTAVGSILLIVFLVGAPSVDAAERVGVGAALGWLLVETLGCTILTAGVGRWAVDSHMRKERRRRATRLRDFLKS